MSGESFAIKSLLIQNGIMLGFLGLVLGFLAHGILRKSRRHTAIFTLWLLLVLWFFNSPFFGFSRVSLVPEGIRIDYGLLSVRNAILPLDSAWRVESYLGGIRKNRRLYFISIGGHRSMKVRGERQRLFLEEIGRKIEEARSKYRPGN